LQGFFYVSIPERVLGWLKPVTFSALDGSWMDRYVSIPERVLGWLKQDAQRIAHRLLQFQSLKGFWVG